MQFSAKPHFFGRFFRTIKNMTQKFTGPNKEILRSQIAEHIAEIEKAEKKYGFNFSLPAVAQRSFL